MSHVVAVQTVLLATPAVVALVGTRIYPGVMPQNVVMPALVLTVVTDVGEDTFDSDAATVLRNARVQIDGYAEQYKDAEAAMNAVDDAMQAQSAEFKAYRADRRDLYETPTRLHRISMDFSVWRGR